MRRRMMRIRLITMGSALGAFAITSLIAGVALHNSDPDVATVLIILGSLLVLTAVIPFIALVFVERMRPPILSTGQRSGILTYLRVSRYVRAAVEAAVGTAIIAAGVTTLVGGKTFGIWILLFGFVLGLLAAANFWIARRIRLAPPSDPDLPAEH